MNKSHPWHLDRAIYFEDILDLTLSITDLTLSLKITPTTTPKTTATTSSIFIPHFLIV